MSRAGSKRKSSETDTDDYEPRGNTEQPIGRPQEPPRKQQSSPYIGVTKYKRTGRFEAHVWNSKAVGLSSTGKKGRQLHLGSFTCGKRAAKAYDMAALKLKGYDHANTNFNRHTYHTEPFMMDNQHLELDEFVRSLRQWAQMTPLEEDRYNGRATEAHMQHGELPQLLLLLHHGRPNTGGHDESPGKEGSREVALGRRGSVTHSDTPHVAGGVCNDSTTPSGGGASDDGGSAQLNGRNSLQDTAAAGTAAIGGAVKMPPLGLPPIESGAPEESFPPNRFAQRDPRVSRVANGEVNGSGFKEAPITASVRLSDTGGTPLSVHVNGRVVTSAGTVADDTSPDVAASAAKLSDDGSRLSDSTLVPSLSVGFTEEAAVSVAQAVMLAASQELMGSSHAAQGGVQAHQSGSRSAGHMMMMPQPDSSVHLAISTTTVKGRQEEQLGRTLREYKDGNPHSRINKITSGAGDPLSDSLTASAATSVGLLPPVTADMLLPAGEESPELAAQKFIEMTREKMQQFMIVWCRERARDTEKLQGDLAILESQLTMARRDASSAALQARELAQVLRGVALERDQLRAITTATRRALTAELPRHVPVPSRFGLN